MIRLESVGLGGDELARLAESAARLFDRDRGELLEHVDRVAALDPKQREAVYGVARALAITHRENTR